MSTTFGERLGRLIERAGLAPHAIDMRLEKLGLRSRNFTARAVGKGTQDNIAEVFTHLADWLGVSVEYLVAGRGGESAAGGEARVVNVDIARERAGGEPGPVTPAGPNEELERTVLLLARHMGYKQAIDRLVLYRVEPHPGSDPRLTGGPLPPPGAGRNGRTGEGGN